MVDIVIVSAARTPVGNFNGSLSALQAHELAAVALKGAFERAGVSPAEVDEVILGQILSAGAGRESGPAGGPRLRHSGRARPLSASTSSAARAFAPSRSPRSRSAPAKATLSRPAAWRA